MVNEMCQLYKRSKNVNNIRSNRLDLCPGV